MSTLQQNMEINQKIYERNIPSHPIQPYFSFYPVSTKYNTQPTTDPQMIIHPPPTYKEYSHAEVFLPGRGPWHGFARSVNIESELKNQIYPLDKSYKRVYVPSSNSDLYEYPMFGLPLPGYLENIQVTSGPQRTKELLSTTYGKATFNNHTRNQLKDQVFKFD
jgi:hypothetical protein